MLCGQQEILERLSNWMDICNSLVKNLDNLITPAIFDLLDTYFMYSLGEALAVSTSCRSMDRLQFYI